MMIMPDASIPPAQPQSENSSSGASRTTEQIIAERDKTHGDFADNAKIMQYFKDTGRCHFGWQKLDPTKREALEMIFHKIGRILCGNAEERDHWDDIAGYARLAADRCKKGI